MFHDFCAHTGWQLACTSAQLQIFYNERENPIPIETDPELELQAIHASAKKGFIPQYIALLAIALLNGAMWISNLLGDPIDLLSTPTKLFTGFAWLLFINNFENAGFSIMDENYGYNRVCYTGFLSKGGTMGECTIEIYHKGDMVFVDETEYTGMKEVILSHDSEATIYLVPAEVAADLDKYCWDFAANWVWHGPENGKFLKHFGDNQLGAFFGAPDFIDYLNKLAFPDYKSKLVRGLGCYDYEIPEEYQRYPRYNF